MSEPGPLARAIRGVTQHLCADACLLERLYGFDATTGKLSGETNFPPGCTDPACAAFECHAASGLFLTHLWFISPEGGMYSAFDGARWSPPALQLPRAVLLSCCPVYQEPGAHYPGDPLGEVWSNAEIPDDACHFLRQLLLDYNIRLEILSQSADLLDADSGCFHQRDEDRFRLKLFDSWRGERAALRVLSEWVLMRLKPRLSPESRRLLRAEHGSLEKGISAEAGAEAIALWSEKQPRFSQLKHFDTFLNRVDFALRKGLRSSGQEAVEATRRSESPLTQISFEDLGSCAATDCSPEEVVLSTLMFREFMEMLYLKLTPRQRQVWDALLQGETQAKIAARIGLSRSRVSGLVAAIRRITAEQKRLLSDGASP